MDIVIVIALLLVAAIGLVLVAHQLAKAPEGYEDQHGFHVVRKMAAGATKIPQADIGHRPPAQPATAH